MTFEAEIESAPEYAQNQPSASPTRSEDTATKRTEDTCRHGQKIPQPRNGRHLQIWLEDTYNQSRSIKPVYHRTYLHPRHRNLQLSLHSINPQPRQLEGQA